MWYCWLWFVRWGWLWCMNIMSLILIWQLVHHWHDWSTLTKLGAFTVIVLTFHVWEEWVIPGGFHYTYNLHSALPNRYPMSELTDMITNFGGGLLWFILVEIKKFGSKMGLAVGLFSFFEFIVHNLLAWQSLQIYHSAGQTIYYAPGLVTATLCWLPLGIAWVGYFVHHHPSWKDITGGIVLLVLLSLLLVQLPEGILKSPNNPYSFQNAGYYQQFIKHK